MTSQPPVVSPVLPREPDYDRIPPLQAVEYPLPPTLTPMLVIGLGSVGRAVLERLATWLPPRADGTLRGIHLLAVDLEGKARSDSVPSDIETLLLPGEQLQLRYQAAPGRHTSDEQTRWDSRWSLLQDVKTEPPAAWQVLQRVLGNGSQPDVWLVASAFDVVGSGMIFDLAHLARLVGEAQNYQPFIGWMLGLPSREGEREHHAEAAATLRELERLLGYDLPRVYEYNRNSTNYVLHRHWRQGRDDASAVFLCEPPSELYTRRAIPFVADRMALALLALAQPAVWRAFGEDLQALSVQRHTEIEAPVSAFGVSAHYVPTTRLQDLVRTWLTRDVLLEREWGVLQSWRPTQVEPDEDAALAVLGGANHEFLKTLSLADSPSARLSHWPPADQVEQALSLVLRQHFQDLVDRSPPGNPLLTCDQVLAGLEEILLRSNAPPAVVESLNSVVIQTRQELQNWLKGRRTSHEIAEEVTTAAERRWKQALALKEWHSVLDEQAARRTYEAITSGSPDIRKRIRQYIRWAWVVEENHLRLHLDTLYPGWDPDMPGWRHDLRTLDWPQIWESSRRVVTALTQEPQYWPSKLIAPGHHLPAPAKAQKATEPILSYDANVTRVAYLSSDDRQWLERAWLPAGVKVSKVESSLPSWGVSLQVHHLIPLRAVRAVSEFEKQYASRRVASARKLHIFDPEQRAFEIEARAISTVPRRRRRDLTVDRLSNKTVAALQKPDLVRFFVGAWLNGFVEPAFGPGPYRLAHPTPDGERQEARLLDNNHPLDAMQAFVLADPGSTTQADQADLPTWDTQNERAQNRLQKIADWWQSPDPKNVEWYLLVYGLMEGERSR